MPATLAPRCPHAPAQAVGTRPALRALTALLALALSLAGLVALRPARVAAATARPVEVHFRPSATSVPYGGTVQLYVFLRSADTHTPLANLDVRIDGIKDGAWTGVGTVRTNAQGRASLPRTLYSTRTYRARWVGNATWAARTSTSITVKVSSTLGSRAVSESTRHYGKPYQWGAVGPDRFDCSGFTRYVYGRLGKSLPHSSGQQSTVTRRIDNSQKQVGDLIFTWTSGRITHVGIYAGNGEMWAATKTGDIVRKQTLYSRSYTVGRVV